MNDYNGLVSRRGKNPKRLRLLTLLGWTPRLYLNVRQHVACRLSDHVLADADERRRDRFGVAEGRRLDLATVTVPAVDWGISHSLASAGQ